MNFVPAEVEFLGVYFPPLLFAAGLGTVAMLITTAVFNRYRLNRYFVYPEGVMLAMTAVYTAIFGTWVFPT